MKLAMVVSRFNQPITDALASGAIAYLEEKGLSVAKRIDVPGAVEIPLIALKLAKSKQYDAIIALGAVIRGETSHYDYVCQQVSQGCQRVALENEIPVIFGVLTTENEAQAMERVGGLQGHKGREAAEAAIEMVQLMRQLSTD